MTFKPFVPTALTGNRSLSNFKYRNATLDIAMEGYGDAIQTITMDGKPLEGANIATTISGKHVIKILLNNTITDVGKVNKVASQFTLANLMPL